MKQTILVDLPVITEYLKTGKGLLPKAYEKYTMKITSSTLTALLASKTFEDSALESEVKDFIKKYFQVIAVDEKVAMESATLIRQYGLNMSDSLIAGAAKANDMDLLTSNERTFQNISGVKLLKL